MLPRRTPDLRGRPPVVRGLPIAALVLGMMACGSVAKGEEGVALPKVDVMVNPGVKSFRSVFEQNPRIGKDPFFPNSKRWEAVEPVIVETNTTTSVRVGKVDWSQFSFKGISLLPSGSLAMINRYTFAEGEVQDMKMAGGQVLTVRCESIKENSVILRVDDETHELTREVLE